MNIYMMGDSTMKQNNYYSYPQTGWGQVLYLFCKEDILVFDLAENGRSTKSYIAEGLFNKLLNKLQKGDYVICEFGHNDEKYADPSRYTDPFGEYQKNLLYFADEVTKKGANIVFATPITRHKFENGKCVNTHGDYPKAMLELCKKYEYPCVDMTKLTMDLYNKLGEEKTKKFHMIFGENKYENYMEGKDDHSHLRYKGAVEIAKLFVSDVEKQELKISECFIDLKGKGIDESEMLNDYHR